VHDKGRPKDPLKSRWSWWTLTLLLGTSLLAERAFSSLPSKVWFVVVFLSVCGVKMLLRAVCQRNQPVYLEDILWELVVYLSLGLLAAFLDQEFWTYTGRHGGPAIPALILSFVDMGWPTQRS